MEDKNPKTDAKDLKLLYALDFNARESLSVIAKKLGISKQVLDYRLKSLEQKGVITGYHPLVDYSRIGYLYARIFLTYSKVKPEDEKRIVEYFCKQGNTIAVIRVDDGYDLVISLLFKRFKDIDAYMQGMTQTVGSFFSRIRMDFISEYKVYRADSLIEEKSRGQRESRVMGQSDAIPLDDTDAKILMMLTERGDRQLIDMAQKLKMSAKGIAYRLKELERKKVILCHRPVIDYSKLGYERFIIFLDYSTFDTARIMRVEEEVAQNQKVIRIRKLTGQNRLEFEIIGTHYRSIFEFMTRLRQSHGDIIKSYDYMVIAGYHLLRYVPTLI